MDYSDEVEVGSIRNDQWLFSCHQDPFFKKRHYRFMSHWFQ